MRYTSKTIILLITTKMKYCVKLTQKDIFRQKVFVYGMLVCTFLLN